MIYTSFYDNVKNLPDNIIPVAISGWIPDDFEGIRYKKLAPKYKFFMEWKENKDNDFYVFHFNTEVLEQLNIKIVIDEITNKLPEYIKEYLNKNNETICNSKKYSIAFICYEKPDEFCHRHLVRDWFIENNIFCCEYLN